MTDGPSNTLDSDVAKVRLVLIRELETISVYEALARTAEAPEVRAFFEHLAQEEKEHVAEATYLLRKLDAGQDADFLKSFSEAHFRGEVASNVKSTEAPAPNIEVAPDGPPANPERVAEMVQDLHVPHDPRRVVYAIPAPPSASAGSFTVGALKGRRMPSGD